MAYEEAEIESEVLHIQPTRPNMIGMIPYELAVTFGVIFFASNVFFHSLFIGFFVVPFWGAAATLVRHDLNGVRVFFVRLRLITVQADAHRWGAPSASPYPFRANTLGRRMDDDAF